MGSGELIIISVILFVVLFFLCREISCWYFKINQRIKLQEETNNLLRSLFRDGGKHEEESKHENK